MNKFLKVIVIQKQYSMKKTRQDQSNPISLSSKRHSLQQEKLVVPQKIEWNAPLQTMDNNNNKTFFTSMKAQLSNIKNDFQKLIQREDKSGGLGVKEKEMIEHKNSWNTCEKIKSYSSYKPEERFFTEKKGETEIFESNLKTKQSYEQGAKGFNLTKNINEAVNFKNKHITVRDKQPSNNPITKYIGLQPKDESKQTNYSSVNPKKYATNYIDASNNKELLLQKIENQRQKELIAKYEQEISIYKVDNNRCKAQIAKISEQNNTLNERISLLRVEAAQKAEKIKIDDQNLAHYKGIADKLSYSEKIIVLKEKKLQQLHQSIQQQKSERQKQLEICNQKINELSFYNNNLFNDNSHLTQENHQLKEAINHLQRVIEDSNRTLNQSEGEWHRKMQHLQKNLKEYERRQLMFEQQIQRLCSQISAQNTIDSQFHEKASNYQGQQSQNNEVLNQEVRNIRIQLAKQQQINSLIIKKYKEQIQKLNIESITKGLEQTVQNLTDQNRQLKSQSNFLTSKIKQLQEQNKALRSQISLYQQREKIGEANRSLSCTEWEELTERIERLQMENKQLSESCEYKHLLQEVLVQQRNFQVKSEAKNQFQSLLIVVKDQLDEIQRLRFEVEKLHIKLKVCEEDRIELRVQKLRLEEEMRAFLSYQRSSDANTLMEKHDKLRIALEQKERCLKELKQFVHQSIQCRQESD